MGTQSTWGEYICFIAMLSKISRSLTQAQKRSLFQAARNFSKDTKGLRTQATQDSGVQTKEQFMQFSKEPIMRNFGELPFGEIPEPLKYVRPFNTTTLSNGIRVCSEKVPGATANVGVYIGSGSRHDSPVTTGASYLTQKMALRGTSSMTKTEQFENIENLGAIWTGNSDREHTSFNLQCHKEDASRAIAFLGDAVCNMQLNPAEVEQLKVEVSNEHESSFNNYKEVPMENSHFNVYREH